MVKLSDINAKLNEKNVEAFMAQFMVLSQHMPGGSNDTHEEAHNY
jgi:hypothetical protein